MKYLILISLFFATARAADISQFDKIIQRLLRKYNVPGATLAISKDGRLVYAKGFGLKNIKKNQIMTADTRMRLASVSKPLTAIGILKLAEKEKLILDSTIFPLIKDIKLPEKKKLSPHVKNIKWVDLLRHTSGQEVYNIKGRIQSPMQPPTSHKISKLFKSSHPPPFQNVIGYMNSIVPRFAPGEKFEYSNYGYALLGYLISKVTDQSYEQFMKKMIFKPVGINCFDFGKTLRKEQLPNEATYYNFSRGKLKKSIFINEKKDTFPYSGRHNEGWGGAGAWIGSAIDVVKLVNHALCLKSPCLLSKKTLHKMLAYQPLTERKKNFWYGLGWRIQKKRGGLIVYHAGASNGGALSHMVKTDQNVVWSGHFNMRFKDKKLRQEFNKKYVEGSEINQSLARTRPLSYYESEMQVKGRQGQTNPIAARPFLKVARL